MESECLTRHDLMLFKQELISELKQILNKEGTAQKKWFRSDEVIRLLKVSPRTLQTLRDKNILQYSRIGGIFFYDSDDIQALLHKAKR